MLVYPFGFWKGGKVETLVDRTAGTHIGDMTIQGGVAAAFDGTTNQATGSAAGKSAAAGYVGTTWSPGKIFSKAIVYGSNDAGFDQSAGAGASVTLTIYGKNGAPASGTDGTSLGTTGSFVQAANESSGRTITSTDTSTSYTSIWVYVNPTTGGHSTSCAELVLYELA